MSSIEEYELLKKRGTWTDRLIYIRSLPDRTQIETHLKQSANLLDIFNADNLPVRQRGKAAEAWLRLEVDEKQVHQFVINAINNKNIPRRIKHHILKSLHKECRSKKFSTSFYYNLACTLTSSIDHNQFNIDAHTLPYCSTTEQIEDLLSRWSISRFDQIENTSPLRSKLLRYQTLIAIRLIKNDLASKYNVNDELESYFRNNRELFLFLAQQEPKVMCRFAIEHLKRLDKHKRILPEFIYEKQKRMFAKAPDEMIELISLTATYQPG
ncbi:unnamed protein product [Rotaria sordida]|uniref:Uncharacterized protein n=1 Tax=Rotaria sordida TaxID=392033 RepID=A0A815KZ98_9BILA|nr:unnamed protein product [Rotaria sordida]CAF1396395.1 unnamed protein product [Rotaria sordida]